jgi:hypothetical protein
LPLPSLLPIDVIARVSSHLSHRIATTFIDSDAALAADTVHLGTFGFCYQAFDQCSIFSNGCCSPSQSDREWYCTTALYRRSCDSPYVVPIRSGVTVNAAKRAACEIRAYSQSSKLIALFPVVILMTSSDIEDVRQTEVHRLSASTVSTSIDPFAALYATWEGRSLAESVMTFALCKQRKGSRDLDARCCLITKQEISESGQGPRPATVSYHS